MIDITQYIDREKLFIDAIKDRFRSYAECDAFWVYETCFPMDQDIIEKNGKRYLEEPEAGMDVENLMHEMSVAIDEIKLKIDNLFSFLDEIELDYFDIHNDSNEFIVWMNDYWYKEFKQGKWGKVTEKKRADPDYKNWHMEKLVERGLKKGMEDNGK